MENQVVVVGGGTGGYWAAIRAAQRGAQVLLVEARRIGGTCLNWGCIPSKIWVEASRTLERFQKEPGCSTLISEGMEPVVEGVLKRKAALIASLSNAIEGLLRRNGVSRMKGYGRIEGPGKLMVDDEGKKTEIPWDRLILSTGSRPITLPHLPVDGKVVLNSDHVLDLRAVPGSVLIVGGGVIGCEFAFILSALGCQVTVVEALDRVLPIPAVDEDLSKTLEREMKKKKIQVFTRRLVTSCKIEGGKAKVAVSSAVEGVESAGDPLEMEAERVLVCVGRGPRAESIGLETVGARADGKGWIAVNERMETSASGVYAVGDALGPGRPMLAHVASAEGLVAAENATGGDRRMDYDTVPTAIFTTPEAAGVGLTESQARQRGLDARSDSALFRSLGKAHVIGEIAGLAKLVWDQKTGKILGVHILGPHATDLIAQGVLALKAGMTVNQLADTVFAHPTLSEILMEAALKAAGRPVHG